MTTEEKIKKFREEFNIYFEREIKKILKEQRDFSPTTTDLDIPLTDIILSYTQGGKRIRPFLIFLFGNAELTKDAMMRICLASELFHLAAIIHDDIMDDSDLRRGVPTIHIAVQKFAKENKTLGNDIALLLGDVFLTSAMAKAATLPQQIFKEFTQMIQRTIRGQYLDSFGMNLPLGTVSKETLQARHELKTAWYTFTSPAVFGWMLAGDASDESLKVISSIMSELGLLFQIRDDIIDCIDESSGKPLYGDISENQTTWVTLYIKDHYPEKFSSLINLSKRKRDSKDEIARIFEDIDLIAPYKKEFQKREILVDAIDIKYAGIKDKAHQVLSLLSLKE